MMDENLVTIADYLTQLDSSEMSQISSIIAAKQQEKHWLKTRTVTNGHTKKRNWSDNWMILVIEWLLGHEVFVCVDKNGLLRFTTRIFIKSAVFFNSTESDLQQLLIITISFLNLIK